MDINSTKLQLLPDGDVAVPTNPAAARLKLATLEVDPDYVASLTDQHHPLHAYRMSERRGLQIVAARKP